LLQVERPEHKQVEVKDLVIRQAWAKVSAGKQVKAEPALDDKQVEGKDLVVRQAWAKVSAGKQVKTEPALDDKQVERRAAEEWINGNGMNV
jgi:hypothetical protein